MVSDKLIESNHRKHRRSSSPSDDVVKSSKRHKHSHHKHHSKHRHHHHRDKKHDEEAQYDDDQIALDNVSAALKDLTSISNGGEMGMEEGEILEEGRIGEKKLESKGKPGKLKSDQFHENNLLVHVDTLPDGRIANDRDCGKQAQQPKEGTSHCGLTRESERDDGYPSTTLARKSYEDARKWSRDREMDKEEIIKSKEQKGSKNRDRDGDLQREREWEKRKEIEADGGRRKERHIIDRDRRGEKERDLPMGQRQRQR